jgi:transcriptional regulator with XRE-family HTH domain
MPEQVGDRIRKARRRCGLSGAELSRRLNIDRQHLYAIEHGKIKDPGVLLVAKITEVLDVSADYLLSGRLEPRRPYAELDEIEYEPAEADLVPA